MLECCYTKQCFCIYTMKPQDVFVSSLNLIVFLRIWFTTCIFHGLKDNLAYLLVLNSPIPYLRFTKKIMNDVEWLAQ